jgi:hypothetical protein
MKVPDARRQLRPRIEQTSDGINSMILRLENAKRTAKSLMALRRMMKWTLWRGRPLPKCKM